MGEDGLPPLFHVVEVQHYLRPGHTTQGNATEGNGRRRTVSRYLTPPPRWTRRLAPGKNNTWAPRVERLHGLFPMELPINRKEAC